MIESIYFYYRCRDDIVLTWNGSKKDIQSCFNHNEIYKQPDPTIQPLMIAMGTTIHLLDLELGHDKQGHLFTRIYRDSKTDKYELPDKYEYHTSKPSNLFKAALKHAVRCCSNETDFEEERGHLQLSHLMRGFSSTFIDQCSHEFYHELGIETGTGFQYSHVPYRTLRQRVRDNDEQRFALTQQQQQQQQQDTKQNIIRIPYPSQLDATMAAIITDNLINIFKDGSTNKDIFNDAKFELVPRPQTPLTINDYLVDKRPPCRMLTLPSDNGIY